MQLADYQAQALTTAEPRAFDHEYLVPAIVGEIGELFGQQAKGHWHGWPTTQLKQELALEYGDVAWGAAILLYVEGTSVLETKRHPVFPNMWGHPNTGWGTLLHKANNLHTFYEDLELRHLVRPEAESIWKSLEHYCHQLTGETFGTVLDMNLEKLASRAKRGVLQGQGDHR